MPARPLPCAGGGSITSPVGQVFSVIIGAGAVPPPDVSLLPRNNGVGPAALRQLSAASVNPWSIRLVGYVHVIPS